MKGKRMTLALAVGLAGCTGSPPAKTVVSAPPPSAASPVAFPSETTPTPPAVRVALLEPFLVEATPSVRVLPPAPLGGRLVPSGPIAEPVAPLVPSPPTQTVPIEPSPSQAPQASVKAPVPSSPKPRLTTIPPAVVRLLEDERARSVDDAQRRLAAATLRASQASAESKRLWGFVKEGFVAQKQAVNADAVTKDALAEQASAQKALDDAQQRQKSARRDLQAAFGIALEGGYSAIAFEKPLPTFRSMPFTYRLSVLGDLVKGVTVENGTLGRALPRGTGEGGAWIVRCADPSRVRVKTAGQTVDVSVRSLPVRPSGGSGA